MALLSKNQPQERVDKLELGNILPDTPRYPAGMAIGNQMIK